MFEHTKAVGAQATGPAHVREGKGCDDAYAWRQYGESVQVLAVGDGAGSVSGTSAWGSWAATQFVIQDDVARCLVTDLLSATDRDETGRILRLLFVGALRHVAYHASRLRIPLHLMNTTLVVAVLTPLRTWVAEIGDGIVAVADGGDARTILMETKGDGPASDTYFLQLLGREPEHPAFRFDVLDGLDAIALSTDGLRYQGTQVQHEYAAYPGFFEAWWRNVDRGMTSDEMRREMESFPVDRDVPLDDKTLVVGIRGRSASSVQSLQDVLSGARASSGCSPMPKRPPDTAYPRPATGVTPTGDVQVAAPAGEAAPAEPSVDHNDRLIPSNVALHRGQRPEDPVSSGTESTPVGRRFIVMPEEAGEEPGRSPEVEHPQVPGMTSADWAPPTREPD